MRPINSNRNWHKHNLRPSDFNNRQHFSRSKIETKKKKKKNKGPVGQLLASPRLTEWRRTTGLFMHSKKGDKASFIHTVIIH